LTSLFACILAVLAAESAGGWVRADPVLVTGAIRMFDICIVLGIIYAFHHNFFVIGLSNSTAASGFRQGILWSAGFGILALLAAGILLFAGIPPRSLIQISVPALPGRRLIFLMVGGIIGPIAEEIFFRGVIYGFLRRWSFLLALLGSTALFVFSHYLTGGVSFIQIVGGIVFSVSYETSKSLYCPIIIHTLGNLALFGIGMGG